MQEEPLQDLKSQVLKDLGDSSKTLLESDDVGYEALLAIAHMTENPDMLRAAYAKIKAIDDEGLRTTALLDLLDEVNLQLDANKAPVVEDQVDEQQDSEEEVSQNEEGSGGENQQ